MAFKFNLGDEVKDTLTGFKGTISYRVEHLTGCNGYGLQPPMDKKTGEVPDPKQFDENRLAPTGKSFKLPEEKAKPPKPVRGGPQAYAGRNRSL
jgi:hypothetical protein